MNKRILATVLVTAIASTTFAAATTTKKLPAKKVSSAEVVSAAPTTQAKSSSDIRLAKVTPKFGLLASNADGDIAFNTNRNGMMIGGLVEFTTPIHAVGVETGLIYEQLGGSQKIQSQNKTQEGGYRINYIKLPVFAKYYLPMASTTGVYVKAGVSLAQMVARTQFSTGDGVNREEEIPENEVNKTQFGYDTAAGVTIPMGENDLVIEATYSRGLTNVRAQGTEKVYNSAVGLNAGMSLNL